MNHPAQDTQDIPHAPTFEQTRHRFPGALDKVYMDVASRGLILGSARDLAARHLQDRIEGIADKKHYFALVEAARGKFARLIGADADEIAITKNVSEGLNIVAGALAWESGDEVVLCSAVEHPNNIYAWRNLEARGVIVTDLPADGGAFPTAAALEHLSRPGRAPKVMTVSGTSFKPGFRADLDALSRACEQRGTLFVVDAAQSVGIAHLDVAAQPIGALAASTQKGLCALYGMGFLYVRRAWADRMRPQGLARFGVDIVAQHEADYDPGAIRYRDAALRFDLGNYNFLAAALVGESLDLLLSHGTRRIDDYVTGLSRRLADGLQEAGAAVVRHASARPSNIVCVDFRGDARRAAGVLDGLKARKVHATVRGSLLRYSLHLYNNQDDVDAAVAATRAALADTGGHRP
ncbi:aminotransferase class V-fold PLP-dependent enzyme [Achromobacter aloeverae]